MQYIRLLEDDLSSEISSECRSLLRRNSFFPICAAHGRAVGRAISRESKVEGGAPSVHRGVERFQVTQKPSKFARKEADEAFSLIALRKVKFNLAFICGFYPGLLGM